MSSIEPEDSLAHASRKNRQRQPLAAGGRPSGLGTVGMDGWTPFRGPVSLPKDFPPEVLEQEALGAPRAERDELMAKAAELRRLQGRGMKRYGR